MQHSFYNKLRKLLNKFIQSCLKVLEFVSKIAQLGVHNGTNLVFEICPFFYWRSQVEILSPLSFANWEKSALNSR